MCTRDGRIATLLGVYLLACSTLPLYLMATVWCESLVPLDRLLPLVDLAALQPAQVASVQTFTYAACGAILGAIISCLRGLHLHAVVLGNFRRCYSGSYLIGPWAAALLGITSYAMVRGGLLMFGDGQPGDSDERSCYAYLALGILTGFSWERMLARVDDAARQIFGSRGSRLAGRPAGEAA